MTDNRWKAGRVKLVFPPLPAEVCGSTGCVFQEAEFSPGEGLEFYLTILEVPPHVGEMAAIRRLRLFAKTALVRTSAGIVGLLYWTVKRGWRRLVEYEQFLDPFDQKTVWMLEQIARQDNLDVVLIDSTTGEEEGSWKFRNTFRLEEVAAAMKQLQGAGMSADFATTQAAFMREFTAKDIRKMLR